ncbi:MAG: hypothetical protein K5882_12265 [Bacteroidales bacterium]|nr:hypothetical protein [Bacteroidales bacterium]
MKKTLWMTVSLLIALALATPNLSAQVGSSKVVSTKKVDAKKIVKQKKIFAPVDKRWENSIRLLYEFPISAGIHYDGMYRVHKAVGIGFGTGYNYVFRDFNRGNSFHRIPLYAKARFYIVGEKKVNPFFGIAQGIDMGFYKILTDGSEYGITADPQHVVSEWMFIGSHTRLEFGLNIRFNARRSMFFSIEGGLSANPDVGHIIENNTPYFGGYHHYYPAFGANIGFTF